MHRYIYIAGVLAFALMGCQASSTAESTSKETTVDTLDLSVEPVEKAERSQKEEEAFTKTLNELFETDKLGWGNSELPSMEISYGSILFQIPITTKEEGMEDYLGTFFMEASKKSGKALLGTIVKAPADRLDWEGKNAKLEKIDKTTAKLTIDGVAEYTFKAFDNQSLEGLYGTWTEQFSQESWQFTEGLTSNIHITSKNNSEMIFAINAKQDNVYSGVIHNKQEGDREEHVGKQAELEVIDETHVKLHIPEDGSYQLEKDE
ncbi:hypothetical protein [Sediminibacillus albus]|uniref:Lipoprotein n=1 Tax=Sediminibacillus albus TaxID=407036 RepID=A0A1G8WTT6_9BACI|nr:hypothetical protein [Sediminibacillus albus]SDJ81573.1 hypothetical protein SAMN05216243_0989 [Sediminibacillus albus]